MIQETQKLQQLQLEFNNAKIRDFHATIIEQLRFDMKIIDNLRGLSHNRGNNDGMIKNLSIKDEVKTNENSERSNNETDNFKSQTMK
jgi:hypothetical protein